MYMTKVGSDLKEAYQWQAKVQWKREPTEEFVGVAVLLYFKNKRTRDIDNFNKILFDALTGIVWKDDSQVVELSIRKYIEPTNPRIEITIYPVEYV